MAINQRSGDHIPSCFPLRFQGRIRAYQFWLSGLWEFLIPSLRAFVCEYEGEMLPYSLQAGRQHCSACHLQLVCIHLLVHCSDLEEITRNMVSKEVIYHIYSSVNCVVDQLMSPVIRKAQFTFFHFLSKGYSA